MFRTEPDYMFTVPQMALS